MMIACIMRGWTFNLLKVGGSHIRAWLLMAILSDSSRRRTRQCTKCGAAIDWEVVTSTVVSKLRCQATAECKARCGSSKRCKKHVGLGVGEVAATQVTARRTENTTDAESLMKVDDDSGRKQDSMPDQSHLDRNASGVREPAVTEGAADDRRGSGSRYSGESLWSCGEEKMNAVLRNGRSDEGALVGWETVSGIPRSTVGDGGANHKKRRLSGRKCVGCKTTKDNGHDAKECKRCKKDPCVECRKLGGHVCAPGQWCPTCSRTWEEQANDLTVSTVNIRVGEGEIRYCSTMCKFVDTERLQAQLTAESLDCERGLRKLPLNGEKAGANTKIPESQESMSRGAVRTGSSGEARCQKQPEDKTMDEVSIEDLDWDAIENGEQKRLHARVNGEAHVGGLHKDTSVGNVSLAGPKIIRGDHLLGRLEWSR
jgi:hypothetical protein